MGRDGQLVSDRGKEYVEHDTNVVFTREGRCTTYIIMTSGIKPECSQNKHRKDDEKSTEAHRRRGK